MPHAITKSAAEAMNAISILTGEHWNLKRMFTDFANLIKSEKNDGDKEALVERICEELTIHTQIEEEIFYPAVRAAIQDNGLMDLAEEAHAGAKELIAELQEMEPGDDQYDAFVTLLGENLDHHVMEEQNVMFPKAKKARLDLHGLGAKILERKHELQGSVGATV